MDAKEFIEKEGLQHTLAEYDEGGYLGIDFGKLEQALNDFVKLNLPVVSQQRELLIAYETQVNKPYNISRKIAEEKVDRIMKQLIVA